MRTLIFISAFGAASLLAADLVKIPMRWKDLLQKSRIEFTPDHFHHPEFLVGYADYAKLPKRFRAEKMDEQQWTIGAYDRRTLELKRLDPKDHYEGYHDYTALTAELQRIAGTYPRLVRLFTAGKSVQGRELWYVVVSDDIDPVGTRPKLIYHANMHGDEVVGRELMIYFLRHLLEQYGRDPKITQLVKNSEIFIMPSMNPDGFELKRRANAHGVDLNRNFPDRFDSPSDNPAGREIEVQHMMNLAAQNHFVFGMNWHGGEICFNLPWGNISNHSDANKHGDISFFEPIGREYTQLNAPMYKNHQSSFNHGLTYGYEWYPVNGGINDWYNFFRRSLHAVVELSVTKWPQASTLAGHWEDNREAMVGYLWRGLRGAHLDIRDEQGNSVDKPTIAVAALPKRPLTFDRGYVHRLTGDGLQRVTVSAPGFQSKTVDVEATYFDGRFTEVLLLKSP